MNPLDNLDGRQQLDPLDIDTDAPVSRSSADLTAIVERFSTGFEALPEVVAGLSSARMFIGTSALIKAYVVFGLETPDGVVELVGIEIDR